MFFSGLSSVLHKADSQPGKVGQGSMIGKVGRKVGMGLGSGPMGTQLPSICQVLASVPSTGNKILQVERGV